MILYSRNSFLTFRQASAFCLPFAQRYYAFYYKSVCILRQKFSPSPKDIRCCNQSRRPLGLDVYLCYSFPFFLSVLSERPRPVPVAQISCMNIALVIFKISASIVNKSLAFNFEKLQLCNLTSERH